MEIRQINEPDTSRDFAKLEFMYILLSDVSTNKPTTQQKTGGSLNAYANHSLDF